MLPVVKSDVRSFIHVAVGGNSLWSNNYQQTFVPNDSITRLILDPSLTFSSLSCGASHFGELRHRRVFAQLVCNIPFRPAALAGGVHDPPALSTRNRRDSGWRAKEMSDATLPLRMGNSRTVHSFVNGNKRCAINYPNESDHGST